MAKVKVTHESKEIEVDLPQGYLSPDEVRAGFVSKEAAEQIVSDRLARGIRSAKKELLADEEFRTEALGAWGIKPGDKGKGGAAPAEAIAEALKEQERTIIVPLTKERDGFKDRITGLTRSQLHAQIVAEATAAGIDRQFLMPLPGSKTPAIIGMVEQNFGFDEQLNDWLVRNQDGKSWAVSGEAGSAHPYKGVKHFFSDFSKDPNFRGFLTPQQGGAGMQEAGRSGGANIISKDDARAIGLNAERIMKGEVTVQ